MVALAGLVPWANDGQNVVFAGAGVVAVILTWLAARRFRSPVLPLPPGPKAGWLGSVKLPKSYQWYTYAQWRFVYGACLVLSDLTSPTFLTRKREFLRRLSQWLTEKRRGRHLPPCPGQSHHRSQLTGGMH
jgi:hypothetical protein